jgi:hypothetical protein
LGDLKSGVVTDDWQLQGGFLVHKPGATGKIVLPAAPTGSYDLSLVFSRQSGKGGLWLILPAGNRSAEVGIGEFDGKTGRIFGATERALSNYEVPNGPDQRVDVALAVDGESVTISVHVNGSLYQYYKGPRSRLGINSGAGLPRRGVIGLVVYGDAAITVKSCQICTEAAAQK